LKTEYFHLEPTVIDEMANTAFWLGLLNGFEDEWQI